MQYDKHEQKLDIGTAIDTVLYLLAGGVMAIMSFSFFLWLSF